MTSLEELEQTAVAVPLRRSSALVVPLKVLEQSAEPVVYTPLLMTLGQAPTSTFLVVCTL